MTSTKRPFGLSKARMRGQGDNTMGFTRYRVGAATTPAIALGDPVARRANGYVSPATATTDYVLGVAVGFQWVDPTTKRPVWSGHVPAGTSSADSMIWADVVDDPGATFYIQADATVSDGDIGYNFTTSGVANPDANGISQAVLRVASRTSGTGASMRVVGFHGRPDNASGDAYPIVEVRFAQHEDVRVSAF